MSIHKRTAGKQNKYDVKLRRPDGSQYQKTFNTKKEAEGYEALHTVERNNGTWLDDRNANVTFEQMANRWLESNNAKRETSLNRDLSILRKHLNPAIGSCLIRNIKRLDIQTLINNWVTLSLAPATIRRHVAVLSAIFNMAIAEEILHRTPMLRVNTPRLDPSDGRALTQQEAEHLLASMPEKYYALVFIMLTTGIRWSEAAGLEIRHFRPMTTPPTLTIEQGLHETGNGSIIEKPKSAASHRTIVLSSKHVEVIAQDLQATGRSAIEANEPLFVATKGGRLVYSNFRSRIWLPAINAAELQGLKIKDMRKTAATNLLQSGADAKTVTAVLGHENYRTTLNHYAKTTPESLLNAAEVLVGSVVSGRLGLKFHAS